MNEKAVIWCLVVGAIILIILTRNILHYVRASRSLKIARAPHRHLVEMGRERDIFFVPGDYCGDDDDDND